MDRNGIDWSLASDTHIIEEFCSPCYHGERKTNTRCTGALCLHVLAVATQKEQPPPPLKRKRNKHFVLFGHGRVMTKMKRKSELQTECNDHLETVSKTKAFICADRCDGNRTFIVLSPVEEVMLPQFSFCVCMPALRARNAFPLLVMGVPCHDKCISTSRVRFMLLYIRVHAGT